MTAPEQPQAMTLEEAIVQLRGAALQKGSFDWMVWQQTDGHYGAVLVARGDTWPEAVSKALRLPVVERDDTAELVEALNRIAAGAPEGKPPQQEYLGFPYEAHEYGMRETHYRLAEIARAALAKWKAQS